MNFRRGSGRDEPEINLIPFIDVLLVIIIFLMMTTTYNKVSGIEIDLPTASSSNATPPEEIAVSVTASGTVVIDGQSMARPTVDAVAAALKGALAAHGLKMPQIAPALRVLVRGRVQTPSIDAVLALFPRETVLRRLRGV